MSFVFLRCAARERLPAAVAICVSLFAGFAIVAPAAHAATPAGVLSQFISNLSPIQGTTKRTTFVIGLDRAATFQVFSLSNPNRVIIDLPNIRIGLPQAPGNTPIGLVKSFRGGQSAPGKARVVINVTAPVVVESAKIRKTSGANGGHQLVLEIVPVSDVRPTRAKAKPGSWLSASTGFGLPSRLGASDVQPPLPKPALNPSQRRARTYKPVVVIDPGHGGHDSGATKHGAVEKHVVLAFSLALRDKLAATGRYRVLMTRDKDVFIPLGDRVSFAEKNQAALFIAVHADYAGSSARGATIYSLRDSTAESLRRDVSRDGFKNLLSSKQRNAVAKADGNPDLVSGILADLAARETLVTKDRTNVFTKTVIQQMGQTTKLMSNPDRSAGFRVLRTAKVPSVLIELAFVTNRADAARLKSPEWRNKVSGSIANAVENYFSSQIAQLPM